MLSVLITFFAGISTVFGALFVKRVRNTDSSAFFLAFATGIMLMVALGELFPEALECIGTFYALVCVVAGALVSLFLDLILPHHHEHEDAKDKVPGHYIEDCECAHEGHLAHGMIAALLLHNVLEGLATGATVTSDFRLGMNMALGIAIHNIPIGTTLAVSMLSAGKKRSESVLSAVWVGLSQPLGALLGLLLFESFLNGSVLAVCNAVVAGILVFVAFDELWPAARKSGSRNLTIIALLVGICFVPLTDLIV